MSTISGAGTVSAMPAGLAVPHSIAPLDVLAIIAVTAIWGLNFAVAKIGLGELPPLLMMAIRFGAVALILCPFHRLPMRQIWHVLGLSLSLGSVHFSLMFSGVSGLDAATAAILIQVQVPFAALMAAYFYHDRLGWRRLVGMGLAFLGVALIVGEPKLGNNLVYAGMVLLASFIWALANIQLKAVGQINSFALSGWIAFFATPQLIVASWLLERDKWSMVAAATWRGWLAVAFMVFCVSIASYSIWYPMMRKYAVNQVMPFTLLVPVFGVLAGILMLGEVMTGQMAMGAVATILGVAVIVIRRPQLAAPKP